MTDTQQSGAESALDLDPLAVAGTLLLERLDAMKIVGPAVAQFRGALARRATAPLAGPADGRIKAAEAVRAAVQDISGPGFHIRLASLDIASIIADALAAQPVEAGSAVQAAPRKMAWTDSPYKTDYYQAQAWAAGWNEAIATHPAQPVEDGSAVQAEPAPGAHHLTTENIAATIKDLREIEDGTTERPVIDRDWRTWAGVLARIMEHLATHPAAPATDALAAKGEMVKCCGRAMSLGIDCATHGFDPAYESAAAPAELTREQAVDLLLDGIVIESGARKLRNGDEVLFNLQELTDFANMARATQQPTTQEGSAS